MLGFMHRMQIDLPPVSPICNTQTGRIMRRIMERIMRRILEVIIDRDQEDKPERKNSGRQKVFSECTAKGGCL